MNVYAKKGCREVLGADAQDTVLNVGGAAQILCYLYKRFGNR